MNNKIYFFTSSLQGGGAEAVCVNVANALANQGLCVEIIVLNEKKSVYHSEIDEKVGYKVLKIRKMRFSLFKLVFWVLKNKPKKVVVFNYELSILMIFVRFLTFHKFSVFSRNINNFEKKYKNRGLKGKIIKKMISVFYGKSDFVINQCEGMQKQFEFKFPKLLEKNTVIYNPLNKKFDFSYNFLKKIINTNSFPYFLCVGRLSYQKNFHHALDCFYEFLKKKPGYKLIIVGEGELESDLKKYADYLMISNSIEFKGFSRDLSLYYANASATLLTSHFEGFPNVLLESIAHGTPVISVDCESGPSEIIEEGVNGYLVKSRSSIDFSEKMLEVIRFPQLNPYLIYQSSRRFSIEKVVRDWIKIL